VIADMDALCELAGWYLPGPTCRWLFLDIPGRTPIHDRFNVGCAECAP
jgi:hypothetical protein